MEISLFLKLTVLSVIVSFVLIQILNNKENLYLNAANPGTKKLMVVDQTTGAITFLDESVQGIDQALASNDSAQSTLLKSLFGPNLDGTAGVFKTKLDAAILVHEKRLNVLSCGTETCTAGREEKSPGTPTTYMKIGHGYAMTYAGGEAGERYVAGRWNKTGGPSSDHSSSTYWTAMEGANVPAHVKCDGTSSNQNCAVFV